MTEPKILTAEELIVEHKKGYLERDQQFVSLKDYQELKEENEKLKGYLLD